MAKPVQPASPRPLGVPVGPTHWRSLQFFSYYRLIIASLLTFAMMMAPGVLDLGDQSPALARWASAGYLLLAILFVTGVARMPKAFNLQLSLQVAGDVVALTLLMYASGGSQSGVSVLVFVVLAGAGLVGQGRLTLFYASLATLALLAELSYRVLNLNVDPSAFFRVGLTSIGFFGTAISARLLGQRVIVQENLAQQRGAELASQLRISERVIRDMQDGVLIVDVDGRIRQHNPQAAALLGAKAVSGQYLAALSIPLAELYRVWRNDRTALPGMLRMPHGGRLVRVRCLPSGDSGHAVIYVEDMGRIEEQARQIKLAALGRLTANMAHEIRNPLAAISHAAELLHEESENDIERRLASIIGENTRRLNRLVVEIMELGRRDRAQPELISLGSFLDRFVEELEVAEPSASRRVAVTVDGAARVCFDRSHLSRVLWNLAVNALRHASASDTAVRFEARAVAGEEEISARRAELHIIDDGPGIAPEVRGQVFEPFFTTHGSGTGLGLYIARELCDANGALLELLDETGGAHFRITFSGETCQTSAGLAAT